MDFTAIETLVVWRQCAQLKKATYEGCLDKMRNNKHLYDRIQHNQLKFWINSLKHELFLIDTLLETEIANANIEELKLIINYDL